MSQVFSHFPSHYEWFFSIASLSDFFVDLDSNFMIFDFKKRSLNYLSKSLFFPNFSPQFIIQYSQILKYLKYKPWFSMVFTFLNIMLNQPWLILIIDKFGIF